MVEISVGGIDYTNPDALAAQYPGEFETFDDPREALKIALEIQKQWGKDKPEEDIFVAHGGTGGCTMPFEPDELDSLVRWADEAWENTPKCDGCGEPLPDNEREIWKRADDWTGEKFCSENCVERAVEFDEQCAEEVDNGL
jgi:hypothetical protein